MKMIYGGEREEIEVAMSAWTKGQKNTILGIMYGHNEGYEFSSSCMGKGLCDLERGEKLIRCPKCFLFYDIKHNLHLMRIGVNGKILTHIKTTPKGTQSYIIGGRNVKKK